MSFLYHDPHRRCADQYKENEEAPKDAPDSNDPKCHLEIIKWIRPTSSYFKDRDSYVDKKKDLRENKLNLFCCKLVQSVVASHIFYVLYALCVAQGVHTSALSCLGGNE